MLRKILLGCGVTSSVLYVVTDLLGSLRYPGYSWLDQEFSELTAQGSPVRPFMLTMNILPGTVLFTAFVVGIWSLPGPKQRTARITAALLAGYQIFGLVAGVITPMTTREALAAGEDTLRNAFHGPLT